MAEVKWTASLVEERLVEAAATLQRLPEVRMQGFVSTWPTIIHDYWEAYGRHEVKLRLGPPSAAAIDRMDRAMQWLVWLEPDDRKIVWLRAAGEPWKTVCWKVGLSRAAANRHWLYALAVIAWRLEGRKIPSKRSRAYVVEHAPGARRKSASETHFDGTESLGVG